jgi:hypothetical protein
MVAHRIPSSYFGRHAVLSDILLQSMPLQAGLDNSWEPPLPLPPCCNASFNSRRHATEKRAPVMSSPSITMSGGARNIVNLTSAWDKGLNALSSSVPV